MAPDDRRFNDEDYFSDSKKEDYFVEKEKYADDENYYQGRHSSNFEENDISDDVNISDTDYYREKYSDNDYGDELKKENINRRSRKRFEDRFTDDFFKDDDFDYSDNEVIPSDTDPDEYSARTRRIKQKRRKRKIISSAIIIFILIVLIAVGIFFLFKYFKNKAISKADKTTTSVNQTIDVPVNLALTEDIKMVVAGARENLLEPDINLIFYSKFDSKTNKLTSLTIPVNALMDIPGFGLESTNKAVEFGGMDLLMLTLKKALAMDVNKYIIFDIKSTVDKLGGITIDLDSDLIINNHESGEEITLKSGENKLNGVAAISYLKYFSGLNPEVAIDQTINQKKVFDSILIAANGENEEELNKNLNSISNFYETNLSDEEIFQLFSTFSKLTDENNRVFPLDVTSVELEGGDIFYVPEISKLSTYFGLEDHATDTVLLNKVTSDLQVLNGVGTPGIATQVSELFKELQYDDGTPKFNILQAKDADNYDYSATQIIVNSTDASYMALAEEIKTILKTGNIIQNSDASAENIVIIIGSDYGKTSSVSEAEQQSEIISINILNGVGTTGLAGKAKIQLEQNLNSVQKLLEVKEVKDAANFDYQETEIIFFDNTELINNIAQQIQKELGAGVIKYSDTNPDNVQLSIILGKDFIAK